MSADALWVPYYHQQGLTVPFDIKSFPVSKQLYSASLDVPFWKAHGGYLAYPRAWSALRIYYNPKYVHPAPTSWEVLLDPKYAGKFVRENQPTDIVAEAGLATGAKTPYNMNNAELSKAKQFLQAAKPAFLDLVSQNTGVVNALANETAWFTSENLGTDIRVKKAGGPTIKAAIPKEGVVGWLDAEMKMIGPDESRFEQFINAWGQAEYIPPLFKEFEEAWFNEKAYKLLVNQGLKHLADAVGYNDPEGALKAHLKGPQKNPGAYTQVFNGCSARSRAQAALIAFTGIMQSTLLGCGERLGGRSRRLPGRLVGRVPGRRPSRRLRSVLSEYLGFAPAALLFGVFFGVPMVMIVLYSFWTQNGYSVEARMDARELPVDVFSTPVYVDTFLTTLWMTAAATAGRSRSPFRSPIGLRAM